jgi:hypothetical protein
MVLGPAGTIQVCVPPHSGDLQSANLMLQSGEPLIAGRAPSLFFLHSRECEACLLSNDPQ